MTETQGQTPAGTPFVPFLEYRLQQCEGRIWVLERLLGASQRPYPQGLPRVDWPEVLDLIDWCLGEVHNLEESLVTIAKDRRDVMEQVGILLSLTAASENRRVAQLERDALREMLSRPETEEVVRVVAAVQAIGISHHLTRACAHLKSGIRGKERTNG